MSTEQKLLHRGMLVAAWTGRSQRLRDRRARIATTSALIGLAAALIGASADARERISNSLSRTEPSSRAAAPDSASLFTITESHLACIGTQGDISPCNPSMTVYTNSSNNQQSFSLNYTGSIPKTVSLSCTKGSLVTSCSVSPPSLSFSGPSSQGLTVTFAVGGTTGTGSVSVNTSISVSSAVQLTVQNPPPPPDHIVVSPHTWRGAPNASTTLTATVYDAGNNVLTGQTVSWTSRNTNIASVGSSGTSTTVTAGQTIGSTYVVASTTNGKTDSALVTSTRASVTLAASPSTFTLGTTSLIQATVRNQYGTIIDDVPLTWTTSDGSLATVEGSTELAFVTGLHTGTVTITAQTTDGTSGQTTVIMQAAPVVNANGNNTVEIYPATKKVVGATQQTLTITWCAFPPNTVDYNTRSIKVNGVEMKDQFDFVENHAACGFSGPVTEEVLYTSTGTITVDRNTGPVSVFADMSNGAGYHITSSTEIYTPGPVRRGVSVVAEQQFLSVSPSSARSERFTIRNTGEVADTLTLTASGCSAGAIATGCSLSSGSTLILTAGASQVVTASYTASGSVGSNGLLGLKAANLSSTAIDSSWTDVTVAATPSAGVVIAGMAPGANDVIPRGACVTIALTSDAASECGDLRLVHDLPSVRTMGTVRTPTLLYNSQHARPKPIVLADVTLSSGVALPPNVQACIKVAGVARGCKSWAGSNWGSPGGTRRVAILGDDGAWNTGAIDITVEVTADNANQGPYTATGRLFIVNRTASAFGAGWWLAGLEQVIVVSGTELVWIGGDGSARRYVKTGSVWRAPNFAALDSIISAGSGYARVTPQHAKIYFSSAGQHDSTVNVLGHVTRFEYTSGLLTKIRVPKPSGAFFDYTLAYTSGLLDSVQAADGRATKLFRTGARVDSIRDPDGQRVRFASGSGNNQYVVVGRTDRRGNATSFSYDNANRVAQATRPLSNATVLLAAESRGYDAPVPLDSAFSQVDGPRSDVTDVSRFWINAYSAPVRVRDALGRETRVFYNASWPGLADSSIGANRLASRAFYNTARGLTDSVRVYNPLGTGVTAVTKYQWHSSLNRLTSVRTPTTAGNWLVDTMSYNADGTVQWQQRGTASSANRMNFTYTSGEKLPEKLIAPAAPSTPDTTIFSYDALGNLRKQRSPSGILALSFGDAIGRDTLVITARGTGTEGTDSTQVVATGVKQLTFFDRMSRDTASYTLSPQVTLPNSRVVPPDTIKVRSTYDEEGNRHTLTRLYTAKRDATEGGLNALNDSRWEYDALNRVYQTEDAAGGITTFTLDAAGNATATLTPRGHTLKATYDALNRVVRRIVPGVTYESSSCHYASGPCGFPTMEGPTICVGVDTLFFGYDVSGNAIQADNNWARVRRAYLPNGAVKQEMQAIRTYGTSLPAKCGGGDRHSMADAENYSHSYVLSYDYDLAGRRTKLYHPDALDPCSGTCMQSYGYDGTTGLLDTLVHPSASGGTLTTTFGYDDQFRLTTTNHPGGVSSSQTYDHDSRLATRGGPATNDSFTRDAAGRVSGGSVMLPSGTFQTIALAYSGMGALQWADNTTNGVDYEEYKTDALGNRLWVRDNTMVGGIDRTRYQFYAQAAGQLTHMELGTAGCGLAGAIRRSCHPSWYGYGFDQSHDLSGNVDQVWSFDTRGTDQSTAQTVPDESRNYYSADEKLMYANRLVGIDTQHQEGTGGFEEYRYDALGRRVFTRSRRAPNCASPCEAYVERTVWDGSQVLYEIRSSGATGVDSTWFEVDGAFAPGDDPNLYGIVAYAHADGIDQPVGILKYIPNTGWAYVTPHANWKGDWSYGTFSNGTLCLTTGATCPTWPGYYLSMDRNYTGATPPSYTVWWGDLIRGSTDNSGLVYQRNRYYDPKTGRFTQVDPIGLGGGLNSYGFAAGDPVNYSDAFGLCPHKVTGQWCPNIWQELAGQWWEGVKLIGYGLEQFWKGMSEEAGGGWAAGKGLFMAGLMYQPSRKHGPVQRGNVSPAPTNGQRALERSVRVKETSTRRVAADPMAQEFVVFDETQPGTEIFHGHVRQWSELTQEMQNALVNAGQATRKGKIIGSNSPPDAK